MQSRCEKDAARFPERLKACADAREAARAKAKDLEKEKAREKAVESTKRRGKACLPATLPTGVAHVYAKLAEYKNRLAWKGTDLKAPGAQSAKVRPDPFSCTGPVSGRRKQRGPPRSRMLVNSTRTVRGYVCLIMLETWFCERRAPDTPRTPRMSPARPVRHRICYDHAGYGLLKL